MAEMSEAYVRSSLEATADEVVDLLMDKRADYGTTNIAITGLYGVAVRLQDKVSRLLNLLASGQEPNNESIEDTFRDIAGYGRSEERRVGKECRSRWGPCR